MISVLHLDLGAGPGTNTSLGGLVLMRRPAQHHRTGPAAPGWVHPYTGLPGIAVFYNDGGAQGGGQPAPAPVPSPADLANRTPQAQPPAPVPPASQGPGSDDGQVLLDHRTNTPMTQAAFAKIMAKENAKGRRAALRELAESAGIPFAGLVSSDPDAAEIDQLTKVLKDAETARQAQLSEEQRRTEEFQKQQQAVQDDRTKLAQQQAALAESRRALAREQALTRLGALDVSDDKGNVTAPNLQDALAMLERDLRDSPDADQAAVAAAAEALKKRRPELFGAAPAPQTLPPAPSGGPAGGNAPRQPTGGKDAIKEAARKRARDMGLRTDAA